MSAFATSDIHMVLTIFLFRRQAFESFGDVFEGELGFFIVVIHGLISVRC